MSVRIYQLSKQLGMENKQLIALLQERGLKVESPSNTIPNIYADALTEEFGQKIEAAAAPAAVSVPAQKAEAPSAAHFVKSAQHVEQQRATKAHPPAPAPRVAETIVSEPKAATTSPAQALSVPVSSVAGAAPKLPPRLPAKAPVAVPPRVAPVVTPMVAEIEPEVTIRADVAEVSAPKAGHSLAGAAPIPGRPSMAPKVPSAVVNAEAASPAPVEGGRVIACKPPIVVRDFATLLDLKPFRLISELMELGIFASMNQVIDEDVAVRLASRHGIKLEVRHRGESQPPMPKVVKGESKPAEKIEKLEARPPVVCVLGHVDHGKTSLLDSIRKANVVSGEAGGITQHIGAYQVEHNNHKITFLDTPGHAAFSKMRERGANITDIAVLVVAADDGFMPQTDEALKFAQKAGVPLVVAINKIDAKGANIDRVKQQLQQRGIASEDWGGETLCCGVSALKGQGISELLDAILLQAEIMELKAPVEGSVEGTVVESQVEPGMGATATIIVQKGTLKVGASLVCGGEYARVRAMSDEHGKQVKVATPSTPVRIMGWSGAPDAGGICESAKNDKQARELAEENAVNIKRKAHNADTSSKGPTSVEELFAALSNSKKVFKLLVKTDVHGSLEALIHCLGDIKSDKVGLEIIDGSIGLVTKNDIALASASGATIAAFNTRLDQGVAGLAKHHSVRLLQHNIIYEILDQVREEMADLLDPELREVKKGAAEVRQVFSLGKGIVAGCMVTEGKIERDGLARLLRKGQVVFEGKVSALKRFKDDASEVRAGYECGLRLGDYEAYEPKDIVECYEIEKIKPKLL